METGSEEVEMYTGHSIRRGSHQMYLLMSITDERAIEFIKLKGYHAYANYCDAYNDWTPTDLPDFSAVAVYIKNAQTRIGKGFLLTEKMILFIMSNNLR